RRPLKLATDKELGRVFHVHHLLMSSDRRWFRRGVRMSERMGQRSPERDCPVCGFETWSLETLRAADNPRALFDAHVEQHHPDFVLWHNRVQYYYAIPILLFLTGFPVAFLFTPSLILLPWLAAFLVGILVHSLIARGTRRFREEWSQQHNRKEESP